MALDDKLLLSEVPNIGCLLKLHKLSLILDPLLGDRTKKYWLLFDNDKNHVHNQCL